MAQLLTALIAVFAGVGLFHILHIIWKSIVKYLNEIKITDDESMNY